MGVDLGGPGIASAADMDKTMSAGRVREGKSLSSEL